MTLKTRNRTLVLFITFSALCLISVIFLFTNRLVNHYFETFYGYKFLSLEGFSLIKPSQKTVLMSLLFLQLYIPVTAFFLFHNFEKTQSTLIILFGAVLLGYQLEISKLIIALFNLTNTFSKTYLILGKYALMGKLLSLASFFMIASESKQSQKLNIEYDLIMLLAICGLLAYFIPLNTAQDMKSFAIRPGYFRILLVLATITIILTILTFIVNYRETENKSLLNLLFSYIPIIAGEHLLSSSDIFVITSAGAILLIVGTNLFMRSLHKMYLWS